MGVSERSLSYLLRNSGEVLEEVEHSDVVLQRRDGEDLYLALLSRERGVRDSLGLLARLLRAALSDEQTREGIAGWLTKELSWTSFLPPEDRDAFLEDFTRTAVACAELENFEPLVRSLRGWQATAEAYAHPEIVKKLAAKHKGPSVSLERPASSRAKR
jgi:hypothetical protein